MTLQQLKSLWNQSNILSKRAAKGRHKVSIAGAMGIHNHHIGLRAASPNLFLPFEGDNTLAIILSKAFLLAADRKITAPTILRQIS